MIHHNLYFNLSAICFANLNTMQFDKYKERSSSLRRGATSFSDGVFLTFKLTQPSIGVRVCFLPLIGQRKAGGSFPTVCSRNISFPFLLCIALSPFLFACCENHQDRDPPNLLAQVSPLFCNPAKKMSNPVGNFARFGLCLFSTIIIVIIIMMMTIKASYSSSSPLSSSLV